MAVKIGRGPLVYFRQSALGTNSGAPATINATLGSTPFLESVILAVLQHEQAAYSTPTMNSPALSGYTWPSSLAKLGEASSTYPPIGFGVGRPTGAGGGTGFSIYNNGNWGGAAAFEFPFLRGQIISHNGNYANNPSSHSVSAAAPIKERGLIAIALIVGGTGAGFTLTWTSGSPSTPAWSRITGGLNNWMFAYQIDPPLGSTPQATWGMSGTLKPVSAAMLIMR